MKYVPFVFALALTSAVSSVGAQPAAPAMTPQAMFRQGEAEYAAGRYEVAIELWERAYALDPRAGLQYNLAQAYGRTGMIVEERRALTLFLERLAEIEPEAMSGSEASSARARIAAIEARLARTAIVLRGVPRHAVITLDGSVVALEGDRIRVDAGSHAVRVELEGFLPYTTTITVSPAATAEVHVELQVAPQPGAPAVVAPTPSEPEPERASVAPLALLISGGTVFVGGSVLGGIALRNARGSFRGSSDADRSRSFGIAADVTLGLGVALAATGLVLVLTSDEDENETPTPTVALGVSSSSSGTALPSMEVTW